MFKSTICFLFVLNSILQSYGVSHAYFMLPRNMAMTDHERRHFEDYIKAAQNNQINMNRIKVLKDKQHEIDEIKKFMSGKQKISSLRLIG